MSQGSFSLTRKLIFDYIKIRTMRKKSSLSRWRRGLAPQGARHQEGELKDPNGSTTNVPLTGTITQSANSSILAQEHCLYQGSLALPEKREAYCKGASRLAKEISGLRSIHERKSQRLKALRISQRTYDQCAAPESGKALLRILTISL